MLYSSNSLILEHPVFSLTDTIVAIGILQHFKILKINAASTDKTCGLVFLTLGSLTSTFIKTTNEYVTERLTEYFSLQRQLHESIIEITNLSANTVLIPVISNLLVSSNTAIGQGICMSLVLDVIPHYINSYTDQLSSFIKQNYMSRLPNNDTFTDIQYAPSVSAEMFLPGFTRGITYVLVQNCIDNSFLAAFFGGSIRGYMLQQQNDIRKVLIYGTNAAANKLDILKINTALDLLITSATTVMMIEYMTYMLDKLSQVLEQNSDIADMLKHMELDDSDGYIDMIPLYC